MEIKWRSNGSQSLVAILFFLDAVRKLSWSGIPVAVRPICWQLLLVSVKTVVQVHRVSCSTMNILISVLYELVHIYYALRTECTIVLLPELKHTQFCNVNCTLYIVHVSDAMWHHGQGVI